MADALLFPEELSVLVLMGGGELGVDPEKNEMVSASDWLGC